ncbi:MAG TPA: Wzz/FepE/Etk N-terminal domain-containing protein, partial [Tianweitania sediminis]|nr:Wzz/FepE/Etk N-terminal domain-containing protein [Tianweitania sediminis]
MLDRIARQPAYDYGVGAFRSGLPYVPSAYDSFDAHLSYGGQGAAGNQLDLRQLLSYLVRYRLLIASFVLAGLCAGLAFFLTQTQIYRAAARIEISAPSARVVRDLEVVHEAADIRAFQTAIEKLKSRSVAERTVRALGLAEKPAFLVPQPGLSPRRLFNQLLGETGAALADLSLPEREGRAIARVQANLAVSLTRNTGILTISYADADPKLAMAIANQHAQSYIHQRLAETERTTTVARDFIENQVLGVKGRLQAAETALVAYAKEQGLTLEGSGGSLIEQNMRAINAALGDAIGERLAAESLVEQIEAGNGNRLEAVLENRTALEIRSKIVELSATYQQNLRFFKADYPDMRMLRAQIVEYQGQLEELTQAVLASVQQRHAEAVAKEREIEAKLVALKADHAAYADRAINFTILKR